MSELVAELNRLAGTKGLEAAGAANALAGTTNLDVVGAINAAAGTTGLELEAAVRALFNQGTYNLEGDAVGLLATAERLGPPVGQVLCTQAGAYSCLGAKASTIATLGNGNLRLGAIWVPKTVTLDRIGTEITATGDPGSKLRLGIYADNGSLFPGALVLDAGQIAGDLAAVQEITISQVLQPGPYWIGGVIQNATVTQPTVRTTDENVAVTGSSSSASVASTLRSFFQASVTGALPATFTGSGAPANNFAIRTFVRVV